MKNELAKLVSQLVSFNTVSDISNIAMADFLCEFLEGTGFKISSYPYQDRQGVDKVNVIGRLGGEESYLTLSGHMDTVPFEGRWRANSKPLVATKIGDRLYGRGVADMKLFIATALMVAKTISASSLRKPFSLCFTADEEVGCVGAKRLTREAKADVGRYVVLGEPTEMIPVRAHKGYLYFSVRLTGKTGHSSNPKNGISIVPALYEVGRKLEVVESRLRREKAIDFDPNYATLNQGVISTHVRDANGKLKISSKNTIPGEGIIEAEIRTLPGQSTETIFQIIRAYLGESKDQVEILTKQERSSSPAMETVKDSLLVREIEEITGQSSQVVNYNTEGGVYTKAGSQCIIWGPGSIKQAHSDNEFVELKYLNGEVVDKYLMLVKNLCG